MDIKLEEYANVQLFWINSKPPRKAHKDFTLLPNCRAKLQNLYLLDGFRQFYKGFSKHQLHLNIKDTPNWTQDLLSKFVSSLLRSMKEF